jgi:FAD/FMN-containing dehydrogenase
VAALGRPLKRTGKRLGKVVIAVLLLAYGMAAWGIWQTPVEHPPAPPIVNDVTRLNPIQVADVITPVSVDEIVDAVKTHSGPISIGGGRYSMGGQTATEGALQIDMRRLNRVLAFDPVTKTITVQAGIRWRDIQEQIDHANLSVKIMQTYANFTVGGSMSVNVHGRYVGLGPLVLSVRSFKIVLADGSVVEASPSQNSQIFYGAIGGYGGLGVIVEATLDLSDNVRVKRHNVRMPVTEYAAYFMKHVRDSVGVVFHNADIYPPAFERVNAVSYVQTNEPVTVPDRLVPADKSYRLDRFVYGVMSDWPFGKGIRQYVVDPLLFRTDPVEWRNYEASYDVAELEPRSRDASTYVLQEYFVPVERFDAFVPKMRAVFRSRHVNVINVSIRHARPDPGTLLAWAPREMFAFVVYYKQGTTVPDRRAVGAWTRELIDSVLSVGGTYYLPYQPWATEAQFARAYPRAPEFFALKQQLDPTDKFRNTLWDKYYLPRVEPLRAELDPAARGRLDASGTYTRDGGQTFLTHPEWYIVYSSDEYADWLQRRLPTSYPYARSIGQFWVDYREALRQTRHRYPFNTGYNVMLGVIGVSYSAELALEGVYENSIGRFSGWTAGGRLSDEDRYAATVAADYARFIHIRPWYEYHFASKLRGLWSGVRPNGPLMVRKWERRFFLTVEYGFKAAYAEAIELATRATYTPQDDRIQLVVTGWTSEAAARHPRVRTVSRLDAVHTLVSTPRYDAFRDVIRDFARSPDGVRITEIAGNREIFLTGVVPAGWRYDGPGQAVYAVPLPTDSTRKRVAWRVPVGDLLDVVAKLDQQRGVNVDHIYDY